MKNVQLLTDYINDMDKDCPHGYYPRPQLKRDSFLCLNGKWQLDIKDVKGNSLYSGDVTVPFPPESYLSGVKFENKKKKTLDYKRGFTLPEGFNVGRVLLHFGAVDQVCAVFVNNNPVGENEGGYIPFSFDITSFLREGENTLEVRVKDFLDKKYPYGKQKFKRGGMWYTTVSGIWQSVWLESVPEKYIEKITLTPTLSSVKVTVTGGEDKKRLTLSSGEVFEFSGDTVTVVPREIRLWTPEEPNLYYFTIECGEDRVESYFALRVVDVRELGGKSRICLNGKPYVFNGLLDQGYYPDGLFLPATIDGYRDDIIRVKEMGFNMLRKHIKIEPMIFYYLCDKIGIAVFQDMVNNGGYSFLIDTALPTVGLQRLGDRLKNRSREGRRIFIEEMYKTTEHLYNLPSVVYYTVFNEGWGQFCADEAYEKMKSADKTRIIDTTSGWFRRHKSDVDSRHIYFKALKPKKLDGRPLSISEFGGYSYRVEGHLFGKDNYGYKLFNSREEFEDALVALYENEVAPLIKEGASAFVYTQVSDVEDETNGLITYDRHVVKVDSARLRTVMEKITKL